MAYAAAVGTFNVQAFIGQNIRRIREYSGKNQTDFAALLDTDQSTLSQWENGNRMPKLKDLVTKLEQAGIDPLGLFRESADGADGAVEIDPDIAATVAALRCLPRELRGQIHALCAALQTAVPKNYDPAVAGLLARLQAIESPHRGGMVAAIEFLLRQHGSSTPIEPPRIDPAPPQPNGAERPRKP